MKFPSETVQSLPSTSSPIWLQKNKLDSFTIFQGLGLEPEESLATQRLYGKLDSSRISQGWDLEPEESLPTPRGEPCNATVEQLDSFDFESTLATITSNIQDGTKPTVPRAIPYNGYNDEAGEAHNAADTPANVILTKAEVAPPPLVELVPESDRHCDEGVCCQVGELVDTNGTLVAANENDSHSFDHTHHYNLSVHSNHTDVRPGFNPPRDLRNQDENLAALSSGHSNLRGESDDSPDGRGAVVGSAAVNGSMNRPEDTPTKPKTDTPEPFDVYITQSRNCENTIGNLRVKGYALDNYDEYLSYERSAKKCEFYNRILIRLLDEGAVFKREPKVENRLPVPRDPEGIRAYPWVKASRIQAYKKVENAFKNETAKRKKAMERSNSRFA